MAVNPDPNADTVGLHTANHFFLFFRGWKPNAVLGEPWETKKQVAKAPSFFFLIHVYVEQGI